jgi:catechol 2,3-dioxygenase-like lactoylglutathione lyase family enzyme
MAQKTRALNPLPAALNHIHLTAEDPETELAFLSDVLGFRRDSSNPGFLWLGNLQLAVTKGEPVRNTRFHLGFRMDSKEHVDALRGRLRERGVEASEPFANGSYYSCAFRDPAGYQIEIFADGGIPALGTLPD